MKSAKFFLVPLLFFVGALVAVAQETGNMDSQEFVNEAASGGMMEVALGEMASQKAASDDVKSFGQKMVEDHSKANEELKQIAASNNLTIPETMMDKQQKMVDKLSELSGAEFDKEYMKAMLKDHKKDIKKFEKAAENADNAEVQAWAEKTLDVLEQHHQLAEETQQTVQASAN
jgi:putative membrane protein